MGQQSIQVKAHLVAGNNEIPIEASYTSKYSLLVRFLNGNGAFKEADACRVVLPLNGENIELGPCQLLPELNIDGYAGRLVFLNEVFDLERFFFDKKLVTLQSSSINLPLVLGHKSNIRQSFRNYTADLTYDLSVYKNLLDSLDSEYAKEPDHIKGKIQHAILDTEGKRLMRYLDEQLEEFEGLIAGFSKEEHQTHGFYFRKQLWHIILCSEFMTRTNLKPRGYSGDSEMMRMIYANDYRGDSSFSKALNKHPLEHPAAQAVRNRRDIVSKKLSTLQEKYGDRPGKKLKILSVACGPAYEVRDLLKSAEDCQRYHFTLLDQDRYALLEGAKLIHSIESSLDAKVDVQYLNESVRTMLSTPQLKKKWGQYDFIYSMGLFDYLTPPVAAAVLGKLYQLLKPEGELVIGNFHVGNPSRYYMEYWLDWVLYYRTEDDFKNLVKKAPSAEVTVASDDTGVQMFLQVRNTATLN
jgi:extracellular factor (EF) 3-hydroxypalmitic acid methyl ester biosynthesis protein